MKQLWTILIIAVLITATMPAAGTKDRDCERATAPKSSTSRRPSII